MDDSTYPAAVAGPPPEAPPPEPLCCRMKAGLRWLVRLIIPVILLAALAHNLAITWLRWGDIVYDCGREMDVPKQLLAGKTLYKDVRYWYGPLAPYANALLFRQFGVRVDVLTTAGIVSAALVAWLAYRIVRLFASRLAAMAAAAAFLYICGFAQYYAHNHLTFALPYSYPATYGMLLAMASVSFLLQHIRNGKVVPFILSCVCLGLVLLCKLEVVLAIGVAHLAFLFGWLFAGRIGRPVYLVGYAIAAAIPAGTYGWFVAQAGRAVWTENIFQAGNVGAVVFQLEHAGLADVRQSLLDLGLSAAAMACCLLVIAIVAIAERRIRRNPAYVPAVRRLAVATVALAGMLVAVGICFVLGPFVAFRVLPVLLLLGFLVYTVRCMAGLQSTKAVSWMVLCAFGLGAAARMILRCGAEHYGFYLLVPGLLGFAAIWCGLVPSFFAPTPADSRPDAGPSSRCGRMPVAAYLCGVAMLIGLAWSHAAATQRSVKLTSADGTAVIATAAGTMLGPSIYVGTVDEAVKFLAEKGPATKVVVMPEGCGITFMAGCTNPLGLQTFLPVDFSGAYNEDATVDMLARADPDYILLLPRDVSEYGKKGFGDDYGKAVFDWVRKHYRPVKSLRTRMHQLIIFGRSTAATTTAAAPSR